MSLNSIYFKKVFKYSIKFAFIIAIVLFSSSCASTKKRGEASWLKKFYHNTTAYYNGYFNANLLLRESIDKLNLQHQDNFTKILDVYPYLAVENPKAAAPNLDKAIEKVSVVAALHPISYWVDDCYLLIGKSQYLKQDFESAEETMEYFKETFRPAGPGRTVGKSKTELAAEKRKIKAEEKEKKEKAKEEALEKKEEEKKVKEKEKKEVAKEKAVAKKTKAKEQETAKKQREKERKQREKDRKKGIKTPVKTTPKPVVTTPPADSQKIQKPVTTPKPTTIKAKEIPTDSATIAKENERKAKEAAKKAQKSYTFKHRPCYQEGLLWLARIYTERQRYFEAQALLEQLDFDPATFSEIKMQTAAAQAHLYIKQKRYELAIAPLERAQKLSRKRADKARFAYILGQLYQEQNQGETAYAYFDKVVGYHPNYEMEFNAKLQMSLNGYKSGKYTLDQAIANLKRMIDDPKNKEYLDQIYFTLGKVSLQNNKKDEAIAYFKQSLENNSANKALKLESYLTLARLYFKDDKFILSKNYYDSTLTVISKTDDDYSEAFSYSQNLTDIAQNLKVIQEQDSLLMVAKMTPKEKRTLASKILKEQQDRERALKEKELAAMRPGNANLGISELSLQGSSSRPRSNFFAYDSKALTKGKRDFEKKFGTRKLEDNWRRSNRRNANQEDLATNDISAYEASKLTDEEINKMFPTLPDSPEKVAASEEKIRDAMFALGGLFRDRLKNYQKSVEILEQLNTRFPANKHELDSWYFLYLSYTDLNNKPKAQEYYDKITQKYPNTTYARVLQDPNFLENSKKKERNINQYYDSTYTAFSNGNFKDAFERANQAPAIFGNAIQPIQPKFSLLSALCIGNLQGREPYVAALKEVVAKYPETKEQKRAKEILRYLLGDGVAVGADSTRKTTMQSMDTIINSGYLVEPEGLHYCIVLLEGNEVRVDEVKAQISDFNRQFFKLDQLKVSNLYLGSDTNQPIILIRKFDNKNSAMGYYKAVDKNKLAFLNNTFKYKIFPVTQNNYRQILKERSIDNYLRFFEENYK